jgi:hypothetical protein
MNGSGANSEMATLVKEPKHCMFSSHHDGDYDEDEEDSVMYSPLKLNQSNNSSYHRKKRAFDDAES